MGDSHFTKGKVASVAATIALLFLCLSKVIPLSQHSGIVEWCEDTVPLGEYLIGRPGTKTGAHSRYYPGDWTSLDCRKRVKVNRTSSCFPGGLVAVPMMEAWSNPNLNPNPHAPSGLTLTTEISIFCCFLCLACHLFLILSQWRLFPEKQAIGCMYASRSILSHFNSASKSLVINSTEKIVRCLSNSTTREDKSSQPNA